MAFGKEIKRLREASKISAAKMAKLMNVDAERLRKWEQRDLSPKDEDTVSIEAFFGMPIEAVHKLEGIKEFLKVPIPAKNQNPAAEATGLVTAQKLIKSLENDLEEANSKNDRLQFNLNDIRASVQSIQETQNEILSLLRDSTGKRSVQVVKAKSTRKKGSSQA